MAEQVSSLKTGIKYKDTPIGKIPVDWSSKSVGEVCDILDSRRIPLNKEQRDKMRGSIPYYGANGVVDYINDSIFEDDLILMAEDGGYFEDYKNRPIAYLIHGKSWVNNHAHVLKVKEPNNTSWVFYSLAHKNIVPFIKGGTRSKLNQQELRQILFPLPPLSEQEEIADILKTVDQAIEKTDQIIEKTKEVKKGLMQTLFTRGIGHKKFKKTEIGEIPEEWSLLTLEEIVKKARGSIKRGPFGGAIKKEFFVPEGYKVYEQKNVIYNDFELGDYYIDEDKFEELKDFQISQDDLLISCSGTIGRIVLVPRNVKKGIINQALLRITLDEEKMMPEFFKHLFETDSMQKKVISHTHGSAMKNIVSMTELKKIQFVVPSIEEQNKIVELINGVDSKVEDEQAYKLDLEQIKKGLMQVLLTGKIRVAV
jgi:type I restriction enzyme S subunit